jgi:Mg2+ and Co2+ transporter CorA
MVIGNKREEISDTSDDLGNPYENILDETRLLEEIKDVLDELNILKALAQDQERVDNAWKRVATKVKISRAVSASEIKTEIESMIEDAKSVQGDINSLLDLKQKEAGIVEAQATRRQSDTVMTFTIVTIIFVCDHSSVAELLANASSYPRHS